MINLILQKVRSAKISFLPVFSPETPAILSMTKLSVLTGFVVLLLSSLTIFSQVPGPTPSNSRVIVIGSTPARSPYATPTPVKLVVTDTLPLATPTPAPRPVPTPTPFAQGNQAVPRDNSAPSGYRSLSFTQIKSKISEARRQMQSRPMPTSMINTFLITDFVRVAFYDWKTHQIDYIVLSKTSFLSTKYDSTAMSSNGKLITVHTIRANGVNTPIVLRDAAGQAHLPLLVQYPVEKGGRYTETAYYMSTHPGLVTPEIVNAGKLYVHNTIEIAREKLRTRGVIIQPKIADMAERLAVVEHTDPVRFRTEYAPNIYNDIYTLYALNEGQTYRYSVSSAGAGGMVQMIPSTYRMVRSRYFNVPLMPDFVEGMRDHVNAAQAMLLYMQMTWNDLLASPTISEALMNKTAKPEHLMAAGYNSNPAKLPGLIKRAGPGWTILIPRETQIYLQVIDSLERFVPMTPRTR